MHRRSGIFLALALGCFGLNAKAMEAARPIILTEAQAAIGSAVLTSDDVKLGHLIGVNDQGDGAFLCFVQLRKPLRVDTSPLIVAGLVRGEDGTLRLTEDAATLADRMKLPLLVR